MLEQSVLDFELMCTCLRALCSHSCMVVWDVAASTLSVWLCTDNVVKQCWQLIMIQTLLT